MHRRAPGKVVGALGLPTDWMSPSPSDRPLAHIDSRKTRGTRGNHESPSPLSPGFNAQAARLLRPLLFPPPLLTPLSLSPTLQVRFQGDARASGGRSRGEEAREGRRHDPDLPTSTPVHAHSLPPRGGVALVETTRARGRARRPKRAGRKRMGSQMPKERPWSMPVGPPCFSCLPSGTSGSYYCARALIGRLWLGPPPWPLVEAQATEEHEAKQQAFARHDGLRRGLAVVGIQRFAGMPGQLVSPCQADRSFG